MPRSHHRHMDTAHRRRHPRGRPPHRKTLPPMRPGRDPVLRTVFAAIGVPEPTPFRPDPFQREAVATVPASDCLVTAPTGAGKTWIAEQAIAKLRKTGGRAWYASPLKALSNAKYLEFGRTFGTDRVGILTGDRKENPEAPVIVGTTEILRNQLYDAMHRGENLPTDLVVLDEAHFLGDAERGVVWEETMIYLPARIPLLMLSATVGNAEEIAAWLSDLRDRPCRVVRARKRPVPLVPLFLHPSGTLLPLLDGQGQSRSRAAPSARLNKKVRLFAQRCAPPVYRLPRRLPPINEILGVLAHHDLLPAIFFLKARADCDAALELCRSRPLSPEHHRRLQARIDELVPAEARIARHPQRWHLEQLGVGAHHAGQLPAWKLVLETLMCEGLLQAVFATSTVAAGVNFPARTIVMVNTDRFNGREFLPLTSTEFHQMTGRAGRRGMDKIGFAVAVPGKFMDLGLAAHLVRTPPGDVLSQIHINFSMALNLLLSHTPEEVSDLLERSFAAWLARTRRSGPGGRPSGAQDPLVADFQHHLAFLQATGFVDADGRLTFDGIWAAQLRVDQPLLIAEGIRRDLFPLDDPILLAAVTAAFAYDRDTDDRDDRRRLPKRLKRACDEIRGGLREFAVWMAQEGFAVRPLAVKAALAVYRWAGETEWEQVTAATDLAEGDLTMLMLRTADNLRHIRSLGRFFPGVAATADEALELILRDPVS